MKEKLIKLSQAAEVAAAEEAGSALNAVKDKALNFITDFAKSKLSGSPDQKQQDFKDVYLALSGLAQALSACGCTDSNFTDGNMLFNWLGSSAYKGIFSSKTSVIDFINGLSNAVSNLCRLRNRNPNIATDVLNYALDLAKRNGYNLAAVNAQLTDLASKSSSDYDSYIISQLKATHEDLYGNKNEDGALNSARSSGLLLLGSILENGGKPSKNFASDIQKLGVITNQMFGVQSQEFINAEALMSKQGQEAFQVLKNSSDLFQAYIPTAQQIIDNKIRILQEFDNKFLDKKAMEAIFNNPLIKTWLNVSAGSQVIFGQIKSGKGIISDATKPGGNR